MVKITTIMKINGILAGILILIFTASENFAQCPYNGSFNNSNWDAGTFTVGNRTLLNNAVWGGDYFVISNMYAAGVYTIDACGSPLNSNLTIYPAAGGTAIAFSDDFCADDASITFSPPSDGSYRVLFYTSPGCQTGAGANTVYLTVVSAPPSCSMTASITSQTNVNCNGGNNGSLTVTQSGGTANFNYGWSNGSTTSGSALSTNAINTLTAGTYTVTVTDNSSCTATASTTITQPGSALSASVSVSSNISCNGGNDGALTASATGGTPSYTYAWSNSATSPSISSLSATTYTVTITDANGCTSLSSSTLSNPSPLSGGTISVDP